MRHNGRQQTSIGLTFIDIEPLMKTGVKWKFVSKYAIDTVDHHSDLVTSFCTNWDKNTLEKSFVKVRDRHRRWTFFSAPNSRLALFYSPDFPAKCLRWTLRLFCSHKLSVTYKIIFVTIGKKIFVTKSPLYNTSKIKWDSVFFSAKCYARKEDS